MNGYFLRKMKKSTKLRKENSALFKVLDSRCLYHQQQLMGMLKFLKEEQELCSQMCHSSAQSQSTKQVFGNPNTSLVTCRICSNQKATKSIERNEKRQQIHLSYPMVCLKDLRFTCPNLNLGTIKLNLNRKEDVHVSDKLLYSINTRSKKKKQSVCYDYLSSYQSTIQRKLPVSSLPKIKGQKTVPILKTAIRKHGLRYRYTQPGCQLETTSKCCQTNADTVDGSYMTVMKNVTFKESCSGNGNQNRMNLNGKDTQENSLESSTSSCVNFGSLIKHFINSETDSFAKLLNKKEKCSKIKVQSRLHRNNEKMSIFDSSLSDCQTIDFARKLNNLTDTFPMEKNNFVKTSSNSVDDGITVSIEQHAHNVLVLKDCESTETDSEVQEKITDLPHDTLKMPSKNVNCIINSQLCLPTNLKHSAPHRIVNEKRRENKRRTDQDVQLESTIPTKRYSRNILRTCKFCDISHGQCSYQDKNNLFCNCTIQKNSGILKNFKAGVMTRSTTEKNRNTHLKVVVERLEVSKISPNITINCKDLCKSNLYYSKVKTSSSVLNILQKKLNNVKQSNCLNSTLVAQANYASVEASCESVSEVAISTTSDNSYFSPIKLMFVSKVESEDGVKYTLSSEYTPVNKHQDVELSDCLVETSHTFNLDGNENRLCKNVALLSLPECKPMAQSFPAKLSYCSYQSTFETETSRCEKDVCQFSKNIKTLPESQHKECSPKKFTKTRSVIEIPHNKTARSKESSAKLGNSWIAENVDQNKGLDTRLRIKKVERFLRSSERNLHKHEIKSLNRLRISKRLELKKHSNISGMCKTNGSNSWEGGQDVLSPVQKAITKYTEQELNNSAEQDQNQKTNMKSKWTPSSLQIRKLNFSNHNARSVKPLATSFSSLASNFSVASALCHESKELNLSKCRVYNRRLRSSKRQCEQPLIDTNCTGNTAKNCTANIDLQPNALKWWCASTSKESLLKRFEQKYEQIANTWLGENNGEKNNEGQSLSTLKFCSSEMRSPVQMLFQKKCDTGDLAAWFMQTTETQSLSIVRKTIAQNPLQKINRKGHITKAKKPSINSCQSKKHLKKCAQSTPSETLTELFNVSKTSPGKCKVGQNPNNFQSITDRSQDICVKLSCAGRHVQVCTGKGSTTSKASAKEIDLSANIDVRSVLCQGAAAIPSPMMHIDLLDSSPKGKTLAQHKIKSETKNIYMCCSSKQNIRDCKVFLTKLRNVENKMSCTYRGSHTENTIVGNKPKFEPEWKLTRSFTTKYCLQVNEPLATSPSTLTSIKNSTSKECNFGMCLRKSKRSVAHYDSHFTSPILDRRNRLSKMTLIQHTNTKRSKPHIPNMGKLQSECPKFHLGPMRPVGIPAIRGHSSTGSTYSLTPIRIPLK